jgi:hypothetical protein
MSKPELLQEVRDDQAQNIKEWGPYKSYLPADTMPPNDLNAELMEKYRSRQEPTYIDWPY